MKVQTFSKVVALSLLVYPFIVIAGGSDLYEMTTSPKSNTFVRASTAFGSRYINDQIISNDRWDNVLRLSLSLIKKSRTKKLRYGLQLGANSSWFGRFNSVNNPSNTTVAPVAIQNSVSLDFLAVLGCLAANKWGFELGFGPQISWIKWQNTVQQTTSRVRVVPKLRIAISREISRRTEIFLAASEAFNPYKSLRCSSGRFNCFNDNGYVSVTDLMLGISHYF